MVLVSTCAQVLPDVPDQQGRDRAHGSGAYRHVSPKGRLSRIPCLIILETALQDYRNFRCFFFFLCNISTHLLCCIRAAGGRSNAWALFFFFFWYLLIVKHLSFKLFYLMFSHSSYVTDFVKGKINLFLRAARRSNLRNLYRKSHMAIIKLWWLLPEIEMLYWLISAPVMSI